MLFRSQQNMTLMQFLDKYNVSLPKITENEIFALDNSISADEIQWALKNSSEKSASGLSGQSVSLLKLIFFMHPVLFTSAVNQIAFLPHVLEHKDLSWIRKRKVIYIPKKTDPTTPSDFRPLSMLEVLYKVPSRVIEIGRAHV